MESEIFESEKGIFSKLMDFEKRIANERRREREKSQTKTCQSKSGQDPTPNDIFFSKKIYFLFLKITIK